MNYVSNLSDTANEIIEAGWALTAFEALQIAVEVQRNELYAKANVLNTGRNVPSALERIAIELGADGGGDSIKHALQDIAQSYPLGGCVDQ